MVVRKVDFQHLAISGLKSHFPDIGDGSNLSAVVRFLMAGNTATEDIELSKLSPEFEGA